LGQPLDLNVLRASGQQELPVEDELTAVEALTAWRAEGASQVVVGPAGAPARAHVAHPPGTSGLSIERSN
jgi:hypothetical protein